MIKEYTITYEYVGDQFIHEEMPYFIVLAESEKDAIQMFAERLGVAIWTEETKEEPEVLYAYIHKIEEREPVYGGK